MVKEGRANAENYAVPVVRQRRRRGREVLYVHFQGLEGPRDEPLRRLGPGPEGIRDDGEFPVERTDLQRAQWRAALQVHGSDFVRGELRDAAGNRRVRGQAPARGRQALAVRVAQGQVRSVVADRADVSGRVDEGRREIGTRDEGAPSDGQARYREAERGGRPGITEGRSGGLGDRRFSGWLCGWLCGWFCGPP